MAYVFIVNYFALLSKTRLVYQQNFLIAHIAYCPRFRSVSGQRLWIMALLFRVGDRFGAEFVQVNIGQSGLVDVVLQQIPHAFIFADCTVSLSR